MRTEYSKRNSKRIVTKVFSFEEIENIFEPDDWTQKFKNLSFLEKVGLSAPPETFQVVVSGTANPSELGVVAGICVLRTDEKDRPEGFPINWNHWDFRLREDGNVIMIPTAQKRKDHWFQNVEDWIKRVAKRPPHKDIN